MSEQPGAKIELTMQQLEVLGKIDELKEKLLENSPEMPKLLRTIHTALAKDPELCHFLDPEQVQQVVQGCMRVTKTVVVAAAVKKATTQSGKKLSQVTLDDI